MSSASFASGEARSRPVIRYRTSATVSAMERAAMSVVNFP
jgi:hypothetical protein